METINSGHCMTYSPELEGPDTEEETPTEKVTPQKRKFKEPSHAKKAKLTKGKRTKRPRKTVELQSSEDVLPEGGSSVADMEQSGPTESVPLTEHLSPIQEATHETPSDPETVLAGEVPVSGSDRTLPTHTLQATSVSGGSALGVVSASGSEEEEEIELTEEALLDFIKKKSLEEMEVDVSETLTNPTVQTDTGLALAGSSGQDPSSPPTSEPEFVVEPNFAHFVNIGRSESSWVPQHTMHFFSEKTFRNIVQGDLESPPRDQQGDRAEDSESSDSDDTARTGGDPVVKLPSGQRRQGIPEVQTFGEGGATSETEKSGNRSTFFTEDKYQSLVEKIDQNLSTFQKATEAFQNSISMMTDSFKTLSEEVKNQSSRIENLEGQFQKAQQQSAETLSTSSHQLASDILSKVLDNLNVPFDRATTIAKSLEEAARVPLVTEDSLKAAISTITKASEKRLNEESSALSERMLKRFDSTLSAQVSKFNAVLDSNKLAQQKEFSALFNNAKGDFLKGVQSSLVSYIEGPLSRQARAELTRISTDIINVLNRHIASCPSLPAQRFAAASTEQQKGESSKATEVAAESRRQEEEAKAKAVEDAKAKAEAEKKKAAADAKARADSEAKARAEAEAKARADRAAFEAAFQRTSAEAKIREDPENMVEIASDSTSSDDQHPISEAIRKMRQKRAEPEGSNPADEKRKQEEELKRKQEEQLKKRQEEEVILKKKQEEEQKKRKGKSRVEDIKDSMDTLKSTPPKCFSELQREFPERVYSHLYSQGREMYSYFTLFPINRTSDEVKFMRSVMKDPKDVYTNSSIKPIPFPEVTITTSSKGIVNVKFKVYRENGTEMRFSDVDLLNLCPYDLHDLYRMMYHQEEKHMKYRVAKVKILEAIRHCVRMNVRRDFELALKLGLEQTDLDPPDEDLHGLEITEPYLPIPEANGMSYLNEEGEMKIFRVENSMKYSNDTLLFLYQELTYLNKKLTPQQLKTKKALIEGFKGQLNYRRHIMILINTLKGIKAEAKILEKMLAEKPYFDRP